MLGIGLQPTVCFRDDTINPALAVLSANGIVLIVYSIIFLNTKILRRNLSILHDHEGCRIHRFPICTIFVQTLEESGVVTLVKLHVQSRFSAPIWNKPKVEETVTIHNLPVGIPLDFLKLLIPDAITIELDDDRQKFTLENR